MDSVRFTFLLSIVGALSLGYFIINQNNIVGSKATKSNYNQVAFRDPKLVADHQKLLDAQNEKKRKQSSSM